MSVETLCDEQRLALCAISVNVWVNSVSLRVPVSEDVGGVVLAPEGLSSSGVGGEILISGGLSESHFTGGSIVRLRRCD